MSCSRSQPHSGCVCFIIKSARRVGSGSRLPPGLPRGLLDSPAGPSCSNRFLHPYSVWIDAPTSGAKSVAASPLLCHASRINSFWALVRLARTAPSGLRYARLRLADRLGLLAAGPASGPSSAPAACAVCHSGYNGPPFPTQRFLMLRERTGP